MRRKKSSSIPKKRGRKPRTFLSLFIVVALAITIGIPLTLKLNSPKSPSQEVAAVSSVAVSSISFSSTQSNGTICAGFNSVIMSSTYKVGCWGNSVVSRTAPGASCQSVDALAQDAQSYCNTKITPTPTASTLGRKPPVPCKIPGAGDVNGDGYVTEKDLLLAQEIAVGKRTPTTSQLLRADINGTKTVSAADLAGISGYIRGTLNTFPVCGSPTPTPTYTPNNPWKTPTPTGYNPWKTPTPTYTPNNPWKTPTPTPASF